MSVTIPPIARLYRACEPNESLAPTDPRFVDFDAARGESPAKRYATSLRRSDPDRAEIKLFAGHRGIGKTSELYRLKKLLEEPAGTDNPYRPFTVIYFDVSQTLDTNDLDFPDLLVFIAGQVQQQLKDASIPGFTGASQYLERVWDDAKRLLGSEVELKGADAKLPFGKLALEFKNRPNARHALRAAIEKLNTSLLGAVNDLLATANVALRNSDQSSGLVLLIDGLDKVALRPLDDGRSNTHTRLFCDRADQLAALHAHTVYTVPISLIYSPRAAQLAQTFGEHPVPVPMIRLRDDRTKPISPTGKGMTVLKTIIEKRADFAAVSFNDVFDRPATCHYLCQMSGGHPRHLMMFMQAAMNAVDALPITMAAAEKAVRNYANSLSREIPDRFWPALKKFAKPQAGIPKDDDHQGMLFLLHIFEYMNCAPWYEVNPVIRELAGFKSAS